MAVRKLFPLLVLLILLLSGVASAQVYNCDGKWQSKPCDQASKPAALRKLSKSGKAAATNPEQKVGQNTLTKLRAVGAPQGEYERYSRRAYLNKAWVEVRNDGDVTAEEVKVMLRVPGGTETRLDGPTSIARGEKAKYQSGYIGEVPPGSFAATLQAEISCKNCR